MGIPYYFRYLIKNHPKMVQAAVPQNVDILYLDSNSIVYDCYNTLIDGFSESALIQAIIDKIHGYRAYCRPAQTFIAFDGVAPLSKMDQQRSRRYKTSSSSSSLSLSSSSLSLSSSSSLWSTNAITPGTTFMADLAKGLEVAFQSDPSVIVSSSTMPGEGEHKLFAHLRNAPSPYQNNVVV